MKIMRKFNHWQIAYRIKDEKEFHLIPKPPYAWAADPFFVNFQEKTYLFAELYLYKYERNGVIGYCKYQNGKFSEWTITMDRHWHLSYPNVFVYENELYMCPESYQRDDVSIYQLQEFPDQWKKVATLIDNEKYVDSTFLQYEGENYLLTFKPSFHNYGGQLYLYRIKDGHMGEGQYVTDNRKFARPGGNIINKDGKYVRVSQDCSKGYGCGLAFSEIDSVWPNYKEHLVRKISVDDIPIKAKRKFTGIHTYNTLNGIEVIDLKYGVFSFQEYRAQKRVRKVFLNKY